MTPITRLTIKLFLTLVLSTLVVPFDASPPSAGRVPRIGVLSTVIPSGEAMQWCSQTLNQRGGVEGQNIAFERRSADGDLDQLHALAAELVHLPGDLIVAGEVP